MCVMLESPYLFFIILQIEEQGPLFVRVQDQSLTQLCQRVSNMYTLSVPKNI